MVNRRGTQAVETIFNGVDSVCPRWPSALTSTRTIATWTPMTRDPVVYPSSHEDPYRCHVPVHEESPRDTQCHERELGYHSCKGCSVEAGSW